MRNTRAKLKGLPLTLNKYVITSEIKDAKIQWIKENQNSLGNETCDELRDNLNLQVDDSGVIRTYSRLKNAKVPFDSKAPIFLNKKHKLAELIVYYSHCKCLHRGVKQTLAELRSSYWITRGRSYVKKLLRPCVVCRKLNTRPYSYPRVSELPEFRFDDQYAYSCTGADYFGPLYCLSVFNEDKQKSHKAWVVLFTCAYTRSISLEVVNDSTASSFINSFKRFAARRGCPNTVVTDKGSVFTAEETQRYMASKQIDFKFTLDCAPWQGGIWERLIGCVKRCLKKVIGTTTLNYVELQTVMAEVECILNNRPIGADFEDDYEDVITPNHLMFGRR